MRKLIVSEFVTLDGVMEAPEKWVGPFQTAAIETFKTDEMHQIDALLLGATTYHIFAESWPSRSGALADAMNSVRKHVVSRSGGTLFWSNSQLIGTDIRGAVSDLKEQPGKDILVAGSNRLAQTLMKVGLVDELRLLVYPVVLGSGRRLFPQDTQMSLAHLGTKEFDRGVVLLRYGVVSV
jgi:dihydrofolate reductase